MKKHLVFSGAILVNISSYKLINTIDIEKNHHLENNLILANKCYSNLNNIENI